MSTTLLQRHPRPEELLQEEILATLSAAMPAEEAARPVPRLEYHRQLDFLGEALIAWIEACDESSCGEVICEDLPWVSSWLDRQREKQLSAVAEVRRIADRASETDDPSRIAALVREARAQVARITATQAAKQERLHQLCSTDFGGDG